MPDDAARQSPPVATGAAAVCPWCSAPLPDADAPACPSCDARLVESEGVEILGVTAVDPSFTASAAAPRGVRPLGSLFASGDDDTLPTDSELPALAPPDLEVRKEMLRLEMDARLASLQAEVTAMETEDDAIPDASPPAPAGPAPAPTQEAPPPEAPPEPPADA